MGHHLAVSFLDELKSVLSEYLAQQWQQYAITDSAVDEWQSHL